MAIRLGVDTLCYHCRLVEKEISLAEVIDEVAGVGAEFVQLNALHLEGYGQHGLDELRRRAQDRGMFFTLAGDFLGRAAHGATVEEGAERVAGWLTLAERLGSPYMRCASGFYRQELQGRPDLIAREQRFVIEVLRRSAERNDSQAQILLENHSDFTPEEYIGIIDAVGQSAVGVFLDVINPISVMADPLETVQALAPLAPAGHVKDYRMVSNYVPDRFHRTGFEIQWCYPGEGVADLPELLGAIAAVGREEDYLLSIEGLDNRAGVADQAERLKGSFAVLGSILAGLPNHDEQKVS